MSNLAQCSNLKLANCGAAADEVLVIHNTVITYTHCTTGSQGVIGSWMTFVRFGFKMKHRYLGTSDHTVKVDIDGF